MYLLGYFFLVIGVLIFCGIAIPFISILNARKYMKVVGTVVRIDVSSGTVGNDLDCEIFTPVVVYEVGEKQFYMNLIYPIVHTNYPIGTKVPIGFPKDNPDNPTHLTYKIWIKDFFQFFISGLLLIWVGYFLLGFN
jgi:hypothetical protein